MTTPCVLVLNAGSSSIKAALIGADDQDSIGVERRLPDNGSNLAEGYFLSLEIDTVFRRDGDEQGIAVHGDGAHSVKQPHLTVQSLGSGIDGFY